VVSVANLAALRDAALSITLIAVGIAAIARVNTVGTSRAVATQTLTHATLPTLYASLLVLLSLMVLIGSLRSILRSRRAADGRQAAHRRPDRLPSDVTLQLVRWSGTLALLILYAILLPHIHFLFLTTAFLALLFLLFGRRGWLKVAAASVLGGAAFYLLFIVFLNLPL
jgi:hypothetical protein